MPNVYLPKLLQIRPIYDTNPDTADHPENVLWFQSATAGTPTLTQLQTIQSIFESHWSTFWQSWGPGDKHWIGSVITDWSSNTGLQSDSRGSVTPVAGGIAGHSLPANVAILISYQLGIRYKGGHPRTYLPWVAQGLQSTTNPDQIQAGALATLTSNFTAIEPAMTGSGVLGGQTQVIFRHRNNIATASVDQFHSFTIQANFASQRRRLRRVAHH